MKYVFVDLDEVLIHTEYFYGKKPSEEKVDGFAQWFSHPYLYVARIRPGALELLRRIREIVPSERVFMLTSSVKDYAHNWNTVHGLGFEPHQIYHREDIYNCSVEPLDAKRFPDAEVYHIDNLPRWENGGKIQFLSAIDETPTYIQVTEFRTSPKDDFTQFEIDDVIAHITAEKRNDRHIAKFR